MISGIFLSNTLRQKYYGVFVLLKTNHGTNIWIKRRENNLSVSTVFQHDLKYNVQIQIEVERMVELERPVL